MANKFQFRILTGIDEAACKTKYDQLAVETSTGSGIFKHDPYTFYLFDKGGVGYLGDTPLFGGDASKFNMVSANLAATDLKPNTFYFVTADCTITDSTNSGTAGDTTGVHTAKPGSIWVTNASSIPQELSLSIFTTYLTNYIADQAIHSDDASLDADFAGADTDLMTSAAVSTFVNAVVNSQAILQISFFKAVEQHVITQAEVTAGEITCFVDDVAGTSRTASISASDHADDFGLVFLCQTGESDDDGDDECVFVNLHALINLYVGENSDTTEIVISTDSNDASGHTKKIRVNVNKSEEVFHENGNANNLERKILAAIEQVLDYHEDSTTYTDYDPTTAVASGGHGLSPNKFVSESQLADILAHILAHFVQVQYGPTVTGGSMEEDEGGEL